MTNLVIKSDELKQFDVILYMYPEITDERILSDDLMRIFYYMTKFLEEKMIVLLPTELAFDLDELIIPEYLDTKTIKAQFEKYKHKIRCMSIDESIEALSHYDGQLKVLCWDEDARVNNELKKLYCYQTIRIDFRKVQHASSLCLKAVSNDGKGSAEEINNGQQHLAELISSFKSDECFIFGTGPNLENFDFEMLRDCEAIVTNSMVANEKLMEKIKPKVIVASDPIFHAGPSSYAAAFREKLLDAMDRYGSYFVFLMRDIGVYKYILPERVQNKLIPIPVLNNVGLNMNLSKSYYVGSTSNVMTLFLLPLAVQFAKKLYLVGFDGRPLDENNYFWSHAQSFQINDKMLAIQEAHPAFFDIDYDEYYYTHCKIVDEYLRKIEDAGIEMTSLTESYVPAVKGYYIKDYELACSKERPFFSIIMPAYNVEKYIEQGISSVLNQSFTNYELICVDDGSTDGTYKILEYLSSIDKRIRVFRKENGGVSSARNLGLEYAAGKYICFLDADDIYTADSLMSRHTKIISENYPAMTTGLAEMVDDKMDSLKVIFGPRKDQAFENVFNIPHIMTIAFKGSIAKQYRFNINKKYGEDWQYIADIYRAGNSSFVISEVLGKYRFRAESATQSNTKDHILSLLDTIEHFSSSQIYNKMLPAENRVGFSGSVLTQQKLKRIYQAILFCIFSGTVDDLEDIIIYANKLSEKYEEKIFTVDDIERVAVRTFVKPFGSIELYKDAYQTLDNSLPVISKLENSNSLEFFKHGIEAFYLRANQHLIGVAPQGNDCDKSQEINKITLKKRIVRKLKQYSKEPVLFFPDLKRFIKRKLNRK